MFFFLEVYWFLASCSLAYYIFCFIHHLIHFFHSPFLLEHFSKDWNGPFTRLLGAYPSLKVKENMLVKPFPKAHSIFMVCWCLTIWQMLEKTLRHSIEFCGHRETYSNFQRINHWFDLSCIFQFILWCHLMSFVVWFL